MKILILDACLINFGDDRGGIHHDAGEMPEVPKAIAADLVRVNRALYCEKTDDPDKAGSNTASAEMVKAAKAMAAAKKAAAPAPAPAPAAAPAPAPAS